MIVGLKFKVSTRPSYIIDLQGIISYFECEMSIVYITVCGLTNTTLSREWLGASALSDAPRLMATVTTTVGVNTPTMQL